MGANGATCGLLRLTVLPSKKVLEDCLWPLHTQENSGNEAGADLVGVLEGHEYRYEWKGVGASELTLVAGPEEIFHADALDGVTGRLRPRLATGLVSVTLHAGGVLIGELEIEVRSRKLAYRTEYRWMLRDIADRMTELVMSRFASGEERFEQDETRDAVTLYQRFSFLQALIDSANFQSALAEIMRRPHASWLVVGEQIRPGAGIRADSSVARQISRAGPRTSWSGGLARSLPKSLERRRTESTYDTTPNRFVKYAFDHWSRIIGDIDLRLAAATPSPLTVRGRREISVLMGKLDELRNQDLFSNLQRLHRFPANDQVLQKKEGYRDIYRAYLEFELAAKLSWQQSLDSHKAGIHDVATLYEYWAFVQLADVVARLVGKAFDITPLIRIGQGGLTVGLKEGVETVLSGELVRFGRRLNVELCFNRTYSVDKTATGSWTRRMRPDYSLQISSNNDDGTQSEPVVLHFDAKYRVEFFHELFELDSDISNSETTEYAATPGGVLRDDLLKMHAYRDAIRRTAGAYVLYPGGDAELDRNSFTQYHELLPGLGAFVLRPSEVGSASGVGVLYKFIDDVFGHFATRLTDHERGRYWLNQIYGSSFDSKSPHLAIEPISDTKLLLGFVKGAHHWKWIRTRKSYNVRTHERSGGVREEALLLQCPLLLLYCPSTNETALAQLVGAPERVSAEAMAASSYPHPRGDYLCIQLRWLAQPESLRAFDIEEISNVVKRFGGALGEPVAVNWGDLFS